MKHTQMRSIFIGLAAVLCIALLATSKPVHGQDQSAAQPSIVIGIVDFDLIMNESKAAKSAKAQLDKQAAAFEAEYKKQRKTFNDAEVKLKQQQEKGELSGADLKKKLDELNASGDKIEKSLAQQKKAVDGNYKKANGQLYDTLMTIIKEIASKRGLTLVLNKNAVPVFAESYEITADAMKQINDRLPAIKLQAGN